MGEEGVPAGRGRRATVVAGLGVTAVALLVGGVALANRGADDDGDDVATTPSTAVVTTTTAPPTAPTTSAPPAGEHAPGEDGMPHEDPFPQSPAPALTCAPGFGTGSSPEPTAAAPPGQVASFGPPSSDCHETGTGCVVSFTMRWSDGYVEGASRTLDGPGRYTLEGDRGAVATFAVDGAQVCTPPSITYNTLWSP